MKIIKGFEQGSAEWIAARRCMVTGTKFESVMGTELAKLNLICELIAEEATEMSKEFKATAEMERGNSEEKYARDAFEKLTGKTVVEIGFCVSDTIPYLGISGDGWIKNGKKYDEALEIKCPDMKNSVRHRLGMEMQNEELGLGSWSKPTAKEPELVFKPSASAYWLGIPSDYKWQVVAYFLVNESLQRLNFAVYDARFIDPECRLSLKVVERSNEVLQEAMAEALSELDSFREKWMNLRGRIIKDSF